jgi:hypothetical protein
MHHHTELSFVDEFRWVSPLQYLKNAMTKRSSFWCMLQAGPPTLHYYYFAVVLHSRIILPSVGHSSYHEYHYCQLTRQTSCFLNFYCTFNVFIWISLVFVVCVDLAKDICCFSVYTLLELLVVCVDPDGVICLCWHYWRRLLFVFTLLKMFVCLSVCLTLLEMFVVSLWWPN